MLLILDSSHSMNNDFSDVYRLPAFMDDFIYPEGTVNTVGLASSASPRACCARS